MAVMPWRAAVMELVRRKVIVSGSKSSAVARTTPPAPIPPAIRTGPFGSWVAVAPDRAVIIDGPLWK